ncbi:MAG: hypothetical protein CL676_11920 [Bdellovibrionaceae bacterium]|nr:hypothetical protein [Pseudobdellovibrionaceae bacterium]|tara:strand:+ start:186 stop:626 length:441 start_codon:yes stop_codon:yes gene_type:complete
MKLSRTLFFLVSGTLVVSLNASAKWSQSEQKIIQNYKDRYEDFFARKRAEEKHVTQRASGKEQIKEKRRKEDQKKEAARLKFISQRKPPNDLSKEFQEHLEEEKRKRKAYLKLQEEFSLRQRRLEEVREGAIKIPPVLEFELQDAL